jgi:hypothetical protein
MHPFFRKSFAPLVALVGVVALTGCQASGGGTLPSAVPAGTPCVSGSGRQNTAPRTTFGFHASTTVDSLGLVQSSFNGDFTDVCAGVRLTGTGHLSPTAPPPQAPPTIGSCFGGVPTYQTQDPKNPGTGTFILVVCDAATGFPTPSGMAGTGQSAAGDFIVIEVLDGPYIGYVLAGEVDNGNVVVRNSDQV